MALTHTEKHEEVILNHIGGSLNDQNLDEALGLLSECAECREIYDTSLELRTEFRRTGLANHLVTKGAAFAASSPRASSWTAREWRTLAALAVLALVLVFSWLLYTNKLSHELQTQLRAAQVSKEQLLLELTMLRRDSEELKSIVKELKETTQTSGALGRPPAQKYALRPTIPAPDRPAPSFANPHTVALALSVLRDSEGSATSPVMEITFPPPADLLHLTLSITEESTYPGYRIVVTDEKNKATKQEYINVKKDRFGNFNLFFPRNFFTTREYRIRIFGMESGPAKLLAEQRIRLNF